MTKYKLYVKIYILMCNKANASDTEAAFLDFNLRGGFNM